MADPPSEGEKGIHVLLYSLLDFIRPLANPLYAHPPPRQRFSEGFREKLKTVLTTGR